MHNMVYCLIPHFYINLANSLFSVNQNFFPTGQICTLKYEEGVAVFDVISAVDCGVIEGYVFATTNPRVLVPFREMANYVQKCIEAWLWVLDGSDSKFIKKVRRYESNCNVPAANCFHRGHCTVIRLVSTSRAGC